MVPRAKTLSDVRQVIAAAIQAELKDAVAKEAASRCAELVLAKLRESGVKIVKERAA